ncbi:MAG: hypothetical protein H7332_11705 [Bdellovibrionales bacterium]|nr:hypothetical protein [Ramlibacter sp.]
MRPRDGYPGGHNPHGCEFPHLRQALLRVVAVNGAALQLEQPAGIAFSAGSSKAWQVNALTDVVLAGFTIEQRNGERRIADVAHRYDNLAPEVGVDGLALNWTAGALVEDVAVINAGRNPVSFENSLAFVLRSCTLDGAWNKGDGGSGYLRIARGYRGEVKDYQVRNIRHIALQWSSAFNHIHDVVTEVDVNFHGAIRITTRWRG